MPLTEEQRERYRRNIDVPGFGEAGQERLLGAKVLVVGAGGLGSAALPYLVAAGVGEIGIVDGDVVELMNLQRQVLHVEIGRNKAESAVERLALLNPDVTLTAYPEFLDLPRAVELFSEFDVVLDCVDSFGAKFMISDAAREAGRPLVWATAVAMQGQCSIFGVEDDEGNKLWLRDLHPQEPKVDDYPLAAEVGILGANVGQVGTLQACEAIKLIAGFGRPLVGRVWVMDSANNRYGVVPLRRSREDME